MLALECDEDLAKTRRCSLACGSADMIRRTVVLFENTRACSESVLILNSVTSTAGTRCRN